MSAEVSKHVKEEFKRRGLNSQVFLDLRTSERFKDEKTIFERIMALFKK